jgi:hypothetical protein
MPKRLLKIRRKTCTLYGRDTFGTVMTPEMMVMDLDMSPFAYTRKTESMLHEARRISALSDAANAKSQSTT